jgi:hypothetical protein
MNPNTSEFQNRRAIENVIAPLVDANVRLRAVITRMAQRARTDDEARDIKEIIAVRANIDRAVKRIAEFHPDARPND